MKVILTGSTGTIGSRVLQDCLANPKITSIVALSRRPLSAEVASHPKLHVIIQQDFSTYTPSQLRNELSGASACIWSLGVRIGQVNTIEEARKVEVLATLAAAQTFADNLASTLSTGEKFRFVYVSGALGETDQEKKLWYLQDARRLKGETENGLMALNEDCRKNGCRFEGYVVRPGMVTTAKEKEGVVMSLLNASKIMYSSAIRVDELAATMVELATKGSELRTWNNCDMVSFGREILKQMGSKAVS
jgi:nucleoside-diphosphate-sugar epimerase